MTEYRMAAPGGREDEGGRVDDGRRSEEKWQKSRSHTSYERCHIKNRNEGC
jgi:hypothetical protein